MNYKDSRRRLILEELYDVLNKNEIDYRHICKCPGHSCDYDCGNVSIDATKDIRQQEIDELDRIVDEKVITGMSIAIYGRI